MVRMRSASKDGQSKGNLTPTQHLGEHVLGERLPVRLGLGPPSSRERREHADGVRISRCRTLHYFPRDVDQIGEDGAQIRGFAGVFDPVCGANRYAKAASGAEGRRFESCVARKGSFDVGEFAAARVRGISGSIHHLRDVPPSVGVTGGLRRRLDVYGRRERRSIDPGGWRLQGQSAGSCRRPRRGDTDRRHSGRRRTALPSK